MAAHHYGRRGAFTRREETRRPHIVDSGRLFVSRRAGRRRVLGPLAARWSSCTFILAGAAEQRCGRRVFCYFALMEDDSLRLRSDVAVWGQPFHVQRASRSAAPPSHHRRAPRRHAPWRNLVLLVLPVEVWGWCFLFVLFTESGFTLLVDVEMRPRAMIIRAGGKVDDRRAEVRIRRSGRRRVERRDALRHAGRLFPRRACGRHEWLRVRIRFARDHSRLSGKVHLFIQSDVSPRGTRYVQILYSVMIVIIFKWPAFGGVVGFSAPTAHPHC
mmetsp:Transcript_17003/g.42154  ORF Transcript_17003/g.42154 Transcript_17003/m.42154 type:complete len:272 (+) Transcript_17003:755-1570(+)